MGEVYSGAFELRDGGLAALSNESVCAPDVVALPAGDDHCQGIGTGFAAVDGALQARLGRRLANFLPNAPPHAAPVARIAAPARVPAQALPPDQLGPAAS